MHFALSYIILIFVNKGDNQLQTELLEAILEYIEGVRSFRSVLALGITAYNRKPPKNPHVADVISQLNDMGQQVSNGYKYSREEINEKFTDMLEKLTN